MWWSSQRKFSEKCCKVNGNQRILAEKGVFSMIFTRNSRKIESRQWKSTENLENGPSHRSSRRSRITNRESVTSDLQRAWFPNIWWVWQICYALWARFESAYTQCWDFGIETLSWHCVERLENQFLSESSLIGARVGESGGRTAKNELNHGKMSCTTGNQLPFGGFDASSALRARF